MFHLHLILYHIKVFNSTRHISTIYLFNMIEEYSIIMYVGVIIGRDLDENVYE